jgi:hypothetical protein
MNECDDTERNNIIVNSEACLVAILLCHVLVVEVSEEIRSGSENMRFNESLTINDF